MENNQKLYYRICYGLNDPGTFYPINISPYNVINDLNQELFKSVYYYTEEQIKEAETTIEVVNKTTGVVYERIRGIGGITDSSGKEYSTIPSITNKLVFDFDSKNIEDARSDALNMIDKLTILGIDENNIQVYFSGGKGFHIIVETYTWFNSVELKQLCSVLMDGLKTIDTRVYNDARILRLPLSKHHSGLYTIPLSIEEIKKLSVREISDLAKSNDIDIGELSRFWGIQVLPDSIIKLKELKTNKNEVIAVQQIDGLPDTFNDIDFKKKPSYLTPAKYVLEMGYIPHGYGQDARMILAASYKKAGKNIKQAYYALKAVSDMRVSRYGQDSKFDKDELWKNVIKTVYSDSWKGGTYSDFHPLLAQIGERIPKHLKKKERLRLMDNNNVFSKFKEFAKDIDKNTLKFGIPTIDKKLKLLTGTAIGILSTPGGGKSTLLMNLLANNSDIGESSIFYSLDMNESLVALKQIQRVTNLTNDEIFKLVKDKPEEFDKLEKRASEHFKNVSFSFRFGITPDDIRNDIIDYEEKTGKKVRLVAVDYLENVQSGYNDPVMGAGIAAQQLADIASELGVLMVIILQSQKTVNPGEEITSMRSIKGSSVIEQCLSVALGLWREGQPLKYQDYDCAMSINVLKNRYGSCGFTLLGWKGANSLVTTLSDDQNLQYMALKELKEQEKAEASKNKWSGGW